VVMFDWYLWWLHWSRFSSSSSSSSSSLNCRCIYIYYLSIYKRTRKCISIMNMYIYMYTYLSSITITSDHLPPEAVHRLGPATDHPWLGWGNLSRTTGDRLQGYVAHTWRFNMDIMD
jgi:hypothetical protein